MTVIYGPMDPKTCYACLRKKDDHIQGIQEWCQTLKWVTLRYNDAHGRLLVAEKIITELFKYEQEAKLDGDEINYALPFSGGYIKNDAYILYPDIARRTQKNRLGPFVQSDKKDRIVEKLEALIMEATSVLDSLKGMPSFPPLDIEDKQLEIANLVSMAQEAEKAVTDE